MEIVADGIDDILIKLYPCLLNSGIRNKGKRGDTLEILGVLIRIENPMARISRSEDRGKPFSALGELLWYLSGSDRLTFIERYIDRYKTDAEDDGRLHGAYGPRLFNMRGKIDQLGNVIQLLRQRPSSKQAVIQLFDAEDLTGDFREIPCTTTMQFFVRDGRLHLSVTMRSNDGYFGLPHDVFCFTMLQEIVARSLECELGVYYHYVGSMHVYTDYINNMQSYIDEGWQRPEIMPSMPKGDPFVEVSKLLKAESLISNNVQLNADEEMKSPYWADILRLVQVFWASGNQTRLDELKKEFHNEIYRSHLETRRNKKQRFTSNTPGKE
ncbi:MULTISPECIES: thymidylate synthase [unclassified Phyllobacterium]|uniref:thymidylate synthase n=1 Tax=unclassified Phyllobacterium TaxID=2638441 RepID=UPI003012BA1D